MNNETPVTFSFLLASLIHDMKNSLGSLSTELDEMSETAKKECPQWQSRLQVMQSESKRFNTQLIQLLTFYKSSQDNYQITLDEYPVLPLLEERYLLHKPLLDSHKIKCEIDCNPALTGYMDRELINGVIDNALNNAIRHCQGEIRLRACEGQSGGILIEVADNGKGFSHTGTLSLQRGPGETQFDSGNTGLGLYFSTLVAQLHRNGEHQGWVELKNDTQLGGGCMRLFLP